MKEIGVYPNVDGSYCLMPPIHSDASERVADFWAEQADFWREQAKIGAEQEKAWHEVRLFCQGKKAELTAMLSDMKETWDKRRAKSITHR